MISHYYLMELNQKVLFNRINFKEIKKTKHLDLESIEFPSISGISLNHYNSIIYD